MDHYENFWFVVGIVAGVIVVAMRIVQFICTHQKNQKSSGWMIKKCVVENLASLRKM